MDKTYVQFFHKFILLQSSL